MPKDDESIIDEAFLRRLEQLKIVARHGVRGTERGVHPAWRSGPSLEFLDYRKYQSGDDLRYVDWNVFGRLDKLFIKLFRAEENQVIHLLLDRSGSMRLGSPGKVIYAKKIAAAAGYIGLTHQEKVCITAFGETLGDTLPPVKSRLAYSRLLQHLLAIQAAGGTRFNDCLSRYAERSRRPDVALVISDLLDPAGFEDGLEALRLGRFDIALVHVLDETEIDPTDTGELLLEDIETGATRPITVDSNTLTRYRRINRAFLDRIRTYCLRKGIDYYLCNTRIPFEESLLDLLLHSRFFRSG